MHGKENLHAIVPLMWLPGSWWIPTEGFALTDAGRALPWRTMRPAPRQIPQSARNQVTVENIAQLLCRGERVTKIDASAK